MQQLQFLFFLQQFANCGILYLWPQLIDLIDLSGQFIKFAKGLE